MAGNITTLAFSNVPASGTPLQLVIVFRNAADGTAYNVTWPSSIYWNTSTPFAENSLIGPTLTEGGNSVTVISLLTTDGGTKWRGWVEANIPGQADGNFLYAWGANGSGQLGQGNTINRLSPVQVGALTNWAQISAGFSTTVAIKSDGTMWSWGTNYSGQLGLNDIIARSSPVQVGSDTNWAKAYTSSASTAAIRTTGTLWMWGVNNAGQLGLNDTVSRSSPVQVGSDTNWAKVAIAASITSGRHTLAIKTTGTLWAWGNNYNGQLGQNNRTYRSSPVQIGSDTNWATPACLRGASFAIRTTGTLWSWGNNSYGQLGTSQATTVNRSSPAQVGGDSNWSQIAAGEYGPMVALKTTGTLFTWSAGSYGQLGTNSTASQSSPVQVGSDTDWTQISAMQRFALARKTTGTLWSWGRNTEGQLGLGNTTNRSSPVQVGALTSWGQISAGSGSAGALQTASAINPA
jgi:alpha-tubulin suppressor-like RCC1 family protein